MGLSRKEPFNTKLQDELQPNIGLESEDRRKVVEILNQTLPIETRLTIKTRIAHWNVRGRGYIEQRVLLSSQYEQLNQITEKLIERVQMLGEIAVDGLQEFLDNFKLDDLRKNTPDIEDLLAGHEAAIRILREDAKKCSEEHGDEVTRQILVEILFQHETMAWNLRSNFEA